MSEKRILIINIPVIHRGFLDFLAKNSKNISEIYLVEKKIVEEISGGKESITSLKLTDIERFLKTLGFSVLKSFKKSDLIKLKNKKILLINDRFSRKLIEGFPLNTDIKWSSVFLRWDSDSVLSEHSLNEKESKNIQDIKWMGEAYKEAKKSTDWWRQVGAIIIKDGSVVLKAYNEALPSDYTPYQVGNVRDFVKAGEKQELSSTIHCEQKLIAEAAQKGLSLEGASLYVTHFPCPVCTKLIIFSGIKYCFFSEGASNLSGEKLMKLYGIKLLAVNIKK